MPLSAITTRYVKHAHTRLCQGDILSDITLFEPTIAEGAEVGAVERLFPFVVVLTQDCDLQQDADARNAADKKDDDKYLQSVLLCPAYQSERMRKGEHLQGLGLVMQSFNSAAWSMLKKNNNARYHYLEEEAAQQLPDLVLDFKQYFTAPREFFCQRYKSNYVTSLGPLFRELLSQRFANYLSRIGLPELEVIKAPATAAAG